MGLTSVVGAVTGASGIKVEVEFLVDSGASYTLLPEKVWRKLKLKPLETVSFSLADGTSIKRKISECRISLLDKTRHTPVILGVAGDEPLLGVLTLGTLGLVLDPFQRYLPPAR